jgi:hypothetical protein
MEAAKAIKNKNQYTIKNNDRVRVMYISYIIVRVVGRLGFISGFGVLRISQSNGNDSGEGDSDRDLQTNSKSCIIKMIWRYATKI